MPTQVWNDLEAFVRARAPRRAQGPDELPQAAVALVLAPHASRAQLLLVRRAEREGDPWSGHMALPGGRRDPRDSELLHTARRETLEELGLELGEAEHWGQLDDHAPQSAHSPRILVRPFVFGLSEPRALRLSHEIAEAHWLPLDELAATREQGDFELRGQRLRLPYYRVGEQRVWGMTQRILEPLLEQAR